MEGSQILSVLILLPELNDDPVQDYRRGYKKSQNFLALHVNHERAAIEMRRDGLWEEISTEILGEDVANTGLESDVITSYWLSYDRDNRPIKYGKGYAMP